MTPFRDSHSRPHFTIPIHDLISRPTFVSSFRESLSRLTFATHFHDTICDLRLRLPIVSPTANRYFLSRLPLCDSPTDGRTVLSPQCHLPSVPTLTIIIKNFWNLLSGLASTSSYYPSSCPPLLMA